ncbi:hypothetical protein EJ110_NYTH20772 [Nymphaea thermarum]|nr:hypothetical protein EJ110_NYTH20772 [Nymphaea thermarum]
MSYLLEDYSWQDDDQDWELWVDETIIGFWPKSNYRARIANCVVWGGEVVNLRTRGRHTSTQMGNGHFSSEPIGRVAYISHMALYDLDLDRYDAPEAIDVHIPKPDCYDLKYSQSKDDDDHDDDDDNDDDGYGQHITFGGPDSVRSRVLNMHLSSKTLRFSLLVIIFCNHALLCNGSRHLLEGGKYYRKEVPIKTIMVDDGDMYDCMKLDSQPRKRKPSIIRKIQSRKKPSLYGTITANNSDNESTRNKLRRAEALENGSCPPGSCLVLKATKAGPLNFSAIESFASSRARSFFKSKTTKPLDDEDPISRHEHASASVTGIYGGAEGTLSIWRPRLEDDSEMSLSQIWVLSRTADDFSMSLEAGWMNDGYNTWLYNDAGENHQTIVCNS